MTIGETLLKITDYPFTYSIAILALRFNNIHLYSQDAAVILAAAGFFGTVLAILDPFGKLFKYYLMDIAKNRFEMFNAPKGRHKIDLWLATKLNPKLKNYGKAMPIDWSYFQSAFHTRSIELEKDKIVSMFYFFIIVFTIIILIVTTNTFETKYPTILKDNPICNVDCAYFWAKIVVESIALLVVTVAAWNGAKILNYVVIMSTYLFSISAQFVSKTSVENMSKFIESGDWKTAEYWKNIVENEYNKEEGFRIQREQKLYEHVTTLLTEFQKFKKDANAKNRSMMLNFQNLHDPTKQFQSLEDIFKKFPLYESLMTHLYTNNDKETFDLIHKYMSLISKINQENVEWKKMKDEGINKIIDSIEIYQSERTGSGIRSDNTNEWINIAVLKLHLENFITTNRETLIPVERTQPNSALYKVRFFDRSGYPELGDDRIAELREPNATRISNELAALAIKLRQSAQESVEVMKEKGKLGDQIEKKLDFLFTAVSVGGEPLTGSCKFCRNQKFFDKSTINSHNNELERFPWIELGLQVP
ncbi:MAG: hypothetical protein ACREAD_00630 [Nitrosopumilaceae archaeon]